MTNKKLMSVLTAMAFSLSAAAAASSVITLAEEVHVTDSSETNEKTIPKEDQLVTSVTADLTDYTEESVNIVLPEEEDIQKEDSAVTANAKDESALKEIRLAEKQSSATASSYVNVGNVQGTGLTLPATLSYTSDSYQSNEQALWDFFKSLGFTDAGAAGAMGNLSMESGLNPGSKTANFDYENEKGGGGLAGWMCSGRFHGLVAMAEANGTSWNDLSIQMAYLQYELENTRKKVGDEMKVQTDVDYAADYYCVYFEGCIGRSSTPSIDGISVINGCWYQGLTKRKALARMYYERYAGN